MAKSEILKVKLSTGREITLALTVHDKRYGEPNQVSYDYIEVLSLTKAERSEYLTWIHANNQRVAEVMGEPVLYGFQPAPGVIQLWRYAKGKTPEKVG